MRAAEFYLHYAIRFNFDSYFIDTAAISFQDVHTVKISHIAWVRKCNWYLSVILPIIMVCY